MKKIFFSLFILTFFFISISMNVVFAQDVANPSKPDVVANPAPASAPNPPSSKLQNPIAVNSIEAVLLLAVDIAIYVGVSFAILAIIFVGFKFVMAQGNETKLKEAKEWFFWIIIGLAILISSKVIVEIVKNTLVKSGVVSESLWKP